MDYVEQGLRVWGVVNQSQQMIVFLVPMALLGFALYVLLQAIKRR